MRLVSPLPINDSKIASTNVPYLVPEWSAAGEYVVDDQVYEGDYVYVALLANGSAAPKQPSLEPTYWEAVRVTNHLLAFDGVTGSQAQNTDTIEYVIDYGEVINAVGAFNCVGNFVQVVVTDPIDGEVYNQTKPLVDTTTIVDWFAYFFEPLAAAVDVIFTDLPQYRNATVKVIIDNTGSTAKVGEIVMGRQQALGLTNFGSSVAIEDYSRKEVDEFGDFIIVERGFVKRADFNVTVNTAQVGAVQRALAKVRARPTVFIGADGREELVIYGFYEGFDIVISGPSVSDGTINVIGIV